MISYPSKARRETEAAASNSLSGITWQKRPLEKGVHKRERELHWCGAIMIGVGREKFRSSSKDFFLQKVGCTEGRREKKLCCQRKERGRKKAEVFMGEICTKDSLVASKILPRAPSKAIC